MQSIGARFAHGLITLDEAARAGLPRVRHAGRRLPVPRHRGDVAGGRRSARADAAALRARAVGRADLARHGAAARRARCCASPRRRIAARRRSSRRTPIENAMLVHAAFGGSTNLLLHIPAIAHAAGLRAADGRRLDARQPRDAAAGGRAAERPAQPPDGAGVPGGRRARSDAAPARAWACSISTCSPSRARRSATCSTGGKRVRAPRGRARAAARPRRRRSRHGHHVADAARARGPDEHGGLSRRQPRAGRLGDQGDRDRPVGRRRRRRVPAARAGARVHRRSATRSRRSRGDGEPPVKPGDVIVLIGAGPLGTGMEETYQLTSALKYLPWGKHGRGRHRRALLRRVDRARASATSGPRRWRAARSASCATATSSRS